MKSLIITVAGTARRFNRDTKEDTLKCLYHTGNPVESLLCRLVSQATDADEIIIVGGYLYEKLVAFVDENLASRRESIKMVYNPHFEDYGSGYSLIKGIEAVDKASDEILFVEGDLYLDTHTFQRFSASGTNVLTINREPIRADKAVVLYVDTEGHIHYLYDTSHKALSIDRPFTAIYNSAQAWKFVDPERLRNVVANLTQQQIEGTNLEIIQGYFGSLADSEYKVLTFDTWLNCNTVADYDKAFSKH